MSEQRACTKCGESKPLSEFAKNGPGRLHTACKACQREVARLARLENPERVREIERRTYERNREAKLAGMRAYSATNAEKRRELERKRYEAEKERIKARNYAYRKERPHMVQAWNGSRRAAEKRATPLWADMQAIGEFYALAARLTQETGELHHVDHVIPLRGKNVSGLHVQTNLRVVRAAENLKKGARLEQ